MKKFALLILPFTAFFSFRAYAFAQESNKLINNASCLYKGEIPTLDCVPIVFANIVYWLLVASGTVAVFFIIFGGIRFLTSGGDPKNVEAARKIITWAIIGLIVILLSFAVVKVIQQTTGISDCITRFGFEACKKS